MFDTSRPIQKRRKSRYRSAASADVLPGSAAVASSRASASAAIGSFIQSCESAWESNPPRNVLRPVNGFEDRGLHRQTRTLSRARGKTQYLSLRRSARADLDPSLRRTHLEAHLRERRRAAVHLRVLHTETRGVPRALDLAPIAAHPLALVQRPARVRTGVAHRVDGAVELDHEDGVPRLRLHDHRFAVVEARLAQVETFPLRRRRCPRLSV